MFFYFPSSYCYLFLYLSLFVLSNTLLSARNKDVSFCLPPSASVRAFTLSLRSCWPCGTDDGDVQEYTAGGRPCVSVSRRTPASCCHRRSAARRSPCSCRRWPRRSAVSASVPSPSCGVVRWWAWEARTCPCARWHEPLPSRGNRLASGRAACPARAKDLGTASDQPRADPAKSCRLERRSHGVRRQVRERGPETLHVAHDVASPAAPVSPEPTSPASASHQEDGASSHNSHHHLRNKDRNKERLYSQSPYLFWIEGEMLTY